MTGEIRTSLIVAKARPGEASLDLARVHWSYRQDDDNGAIFMVLINGRKRLMSIRGNDTNEPIIRIDQATRHFFGVSEREEVTFSFRACSALSQILWAFNSSDRLTRLTTRVSSISLI